MDQGKAVGHFVHGQISNDVLWICLKQWELKWGQNILFIEDLD